MLENNHVKSHRIWQNGSVSVCKSICATEGQQEKFTRTSGLLKNTSAGVKPVLAVIRNQDFLAARKEEP